MSLAEGNFFPDCPSSQEVVFEEANEADTEFTIYSLENLLRDLSDPYFSDMNLSYLKDQDYVRNGCLSFEVDAKPSAHMFATKTNVMDQFETEQEFLDEYSEATEEELLELYLNGGVIYEFPETYDPFFIKSKVMVYTDSSQGSESEMGFNLKVSLKIENVKSLMDVVLTALEGDCEAPSDMVEPFCSIISVKSQIEADPSLMLEHLKKGALEFTKYGTEELSEETKKAVLDGVDKRIQVVKTGNETSLFVDVSHLEELYKMAPDFITDPEASPIETFRLSFSEDGSSATVQVHAKKLESKAFVKEYASFDGAASTLIFLPLQDLIFSGDVY